MIRETNAPKAYDHRTEYEKNLDVAALHAGKPIRRITHTNDIYPGSVSVKKHRSGGRNTVGKIVARINKLIAWMSKQDKPVTVDQMEKAVSFRMQRSAKRSCHTVECSIPYLTRNGYIVQVVKPAKDRKSLYKCLKEAY